MGAKGHGDAHRPQGAHGAGSLRWPGDHPAQLPVPDHRLVISRLDAPVEQPRAGQQWHQELQGQQSAERRDQPAAQAAPPGPAPRRPAGTSGRLGQQGRVGQWCRHHGPHPAGEENAAGPVRVLDGLAGCGIRALRYAREGGAAAVWANDADPDRLPLLRANLATASPSVRCRFGAETLQRLLAGCLGREERFELVDLDAFGSPTALLPLALEAVAFGGVLYLASTDGRSPTGHDRPAAVRRLGAAARAHPASWELALRLQLGTLARAAWALGRGLEPILSFSEGRTFRTAVRVRRQPAPGEERHLGLLAHCHGCGDQQELSLLRLGRWAPCCCRGDAPPLSVSGPLWLGPLQDPATLAAMLGEAESSPLTLSLPGRRVLERLLADPGEPAR